MGYPTDKLEEIAAQREKVAQMNSDLITERQKLRDMEREQSNRVIQWLNTQTERMLTGKPSP